MKKRLKINGIIMGLAGILVIIFPGIFFRPPANGFGERLTEFAGMAIIILGQIIRVSARGYKAEHSRNSRSLIIDGPYQVARNPMYLGILLIGFGVVLMFFKWWAILVFLLVFTARYISLIISEEKKLRSFFPGSYEAYCRKVPRLLPGISSLTRLKVSRYLPIQLAWFKKEIGAILPLLFVVLLIELWKNIQYKSLLNLYFK